VARPGRGVSAERVLKSGSVVSGLPRGRNDLSIGRVA